MSKIRSITYFANLSEKNSPQVLSKAGHFLRAASKALQDFDVQTRRFASQPFCQGLAPDDPQDLPAVAAKIFAEAQKHRIDYLSIGPVLPDDDGAYLQQLATVFERAPGVFATCMIADPQHGIASQRLKECARLIHDLSRVRLDGMTNLYFAALANCGPGSPFFPVAYHDGGEPAFALAIQAADLAVKAFRDANDPNGARHILQRLIQDTVEPMATIASNLAQQHGLRFLGFDFSLAPYPIDDESLGGALESLGNSFGTHGLVASASLVMNAIEAADFPKTGFCGLMLPILEDSVLGRRAAEGKLRLNDLLLLSAVCGTGLDCIPLPGAVSIEALRDMLLDVGALALRLDKPLTARLMPFPGKVAGDALTFDFEFFADSRVLAVEDAGLSKWEDESFVRIHPRR